MSTESDLSTPNEAPPVHEGNTSATPPAAAVALPTGSASAARLGHIVFAAASLAVLWNLVEIARIRWAPAFDPWVAETDQKQIVQQFWGRYVAGAFPPGELLETYASVYNGPPIYAAIMSALSTFIVPKDASILLNIAVWFGALAFLFAAGRRSGSAWLGLAAVVLWAHSVDSWRIIAGGHPRSFAPIFIAAFLYLWAAGRHRWLPVLLVLEGGIYPSVLIACGPVTAFVFGWNWWRGPDEVRRHLRPLLEFAVAACVALLLAKAQDFRSPKEWGNIITYTEALQHPAFQKGSRIPYTPFPALEFYPLDALYRLAKPVGEAVVATPKYQPKHLVWAWLAFGALGVVSWVRDRRTFPFREVALLLGCFFAFVLARKMAFSMSLPHRAVSHGWPVILALLFPVLVWRSLTVLRLGALAGPLAFTGTAALVVVLAGNGVADPKAWRSYARDKALYTWIQEKTPVDAIFAGNFQPMDEVPLFGRRRVYVNWKLAHPFRKGYFEEITRRTVAMYDAYYAASAADVVRFARDAGVSFFIVDQSRFQTFERGDGQLFEPLRSRVQPMFDRCRKQRCALNPPPRSAVVFHSPRYDVVDIAKLESWVTANPGSDAGEAPAVVADPVTDDRAPMQEE
jgi:hypothetical protein